MVMSKMKKLIRFLYYLFFYLTVIGWISFILIYIICLLFHFSNLIPVIIGIIAFISGVLYLISSTIIEKKKITVKKTKLEKKLTKTDVKIEPDIFKSPYKTYKELRNDINKMITENEFKLVNSKKNMKMYIKSYHNSCYSFIIVYHLDSVDLLNKETIIENMNNFFSENIVGMKIGGLQLIYVIIANQNGNFLKELISKRKIIFDRPYTHKAIVCSSIEDGEIYLSKNYEPFIKGLYRKIKKYLIKNYKKINN